MNVHATAIAIGPHGYLIEGPSGSGKTTLALAAIAQALQNGLFAKLVADDQCMLEVANRHVIASCPPQLKGLAEIRGLGICNTPYLPSVVIDFVIRLEEPAHIERMPDTQMTLINDVRLPVFKLPRQQISIAVPLLMQICRQQQL